MVARRGYQCRNHVKNSHKITKKHHTYIKKQIKAFIKKNMNNFQGAYFVMGVGGGVCGTLIEIHCMCNMDDMHAHYIYVACMTCMACVVRIMCGTYFEKLFRENLQGIKCHSHVTSCQKPLNKVIGQITRFAIRVFVSNL